MSALEIYYSTLILIAYLFVSYFLIFRSGFVIDTLQLDKNFDQDTIDLNMDRSTILSIAIIVIGGYVIVDEIPGLFRQLYTYFQRRNSFAQDNPGIPCIVASVTKILMGPPVIRKQKSAGKLN